MRELALVKEPPFMNGGIGDLFWIFVMFSMLQPWLRQKMLDSARVRLMHRIERDRGSRVILLVHREETMSFLGFPIMRYIDINDAEEVIRAIRMTDEKEPIDLVLHTPGGLVLASLQIARAIRERKGPVRVFVPHFAMSGGTLIALAADEIIMDSHAVLGPVDPQLGEYPAASLAKVVKTKNLNDIDDKTLILADVGEKATQSSLLLYSCTWGSPGSEENRPVRCRPSQDPNGITTRYRVKHAQAREPSGFGGARPAVRSDVDRWLGLPPARPRGPGQGPVRRLDCRYPLVRSHSSRGAPGGVRILNRPDDCRQRYATDLVQRDSHRLHLLDRHALDSLA